MDQLSSNVNMMGPADGITIWVFGVIVVLKALSNETGGTYSLVEHIVPPGAGPPMHIHTREEETWYVLEGEVTWYVGHKSFHATKGCFIHLQRNVPHTFINLSDKIAHLVLTFAPGGFEQWFLEVGQPASVGDALGEPPVLTPDYVEKALALTRGYGLILVDDDVNDAKDEL